MCAAIFYNIRRDGLCGGGLMEQEDIVVPTSEILHKMEPRQAWRILQLLYAAEYVKEGAILQAIQITERHPFQENL